VVRQRQRRDPEGRWRNHGSFGPIDYAGNGAATVNQTATTVSLVTLDGTSAAPAASPHPDRLDSWKPGREQIAAIGLSRSLPLRRGRERPSSLARASPLYQQDAAHVTRTTPIVSPVDDGRGIWAYPTPAAGRQLRLCEHGRFLGGRCGDTGHQQRAGAIYANYQAGATSSRRALSGGWQGYDRSRVVTVNNLQRTAQADSDGWLLGASLQAGICLCGADGWSFVPSLGSTTSISG